MLKGKNARFWVYWNGTFSQIVMQPGSEFVLQNSEATEEGFASRVHCYMFDGDTVTMSWANRERDCDGFYERAGCMNCNIQELRDGKISEFQREEYPWLGRLPRWEMAETSYRDHSAERAGY